MEFKQVTGLSFFLNSDQLSSVIDQVAVQANLRKTQQDKAINRVEVETVVKKTNDFIEPLQTNLKFVLHDELNEYYVTIVNPDTNEVIREIPPKKMLDMYAAMAELMGLFIDLKI